MTKNKFPHGSLHSQDDVMDAVLASIAKLLTYGLTPEALKIALLMLQELIRVSLLDEDAEPGDSLLNHLTER